MIELKNEIIIKVSEAMNINYKEGELKGKNELI